MSVIYTLHSQIEWLFGKDVAVIGYDYQQAHNKYPSTVMQERKKTTKNLMHVPSFGVSMTTRSPVGNSKCFGGKYGFFIEGLCISSPIMEGAGFS
jgi:hypothetical protein